MRPHHADLQQLDKAGHLLYPPRLRPSEAFAVLSQLRAGQETSGDNVTQAQAGVFITNLQTALERIAQPGGPLAAKLADMRAKSAAACGH